MTRMGRSPRACSESSTAAISSTGRRCCRCRTRLPRSRGRCSWTRWCCTIGSRASAPAFSPSVPPARRPQRDGKVITAWNALAIAAFARAGAALGRLDYVAIARTCADFVLEHLVRDGVVHRIWNGADARIIGFLDDVANLGDALLTLYEATGEPRYFIAALRCCERVVGQHRDSDGNYFDTAADCGAAHRAPAHHRRQPGERRSVGRGAAVLPDARVHR